MDHRNPDKMSERELRHIVKHYFSCRPELQATLDHLKALGDQSSEDEYLDSGDALDALAKAYNAIEALFTPYRDEPVATPFPVKKYSVHIRLADEVYARNSTHAYDQMMAAFEDRDGFEIMGHDIIEESE